MMNKKPDVRHMEIRPLLGILAAADVTLDALIGGLRDLFPEIDDDFAYQVDSSQTSNDARTTIVLAQALQAMVSRICDNQLQLVDPYDDHPF